MSKAGLGILFSSLAIASRTSSADRLNVVRSCGADIRVAENALDDHIRHTETIKVTSQAAAASVPSMPLRELGVPFVFVIDEGAIIFGLVADLAAVQCGKYVAL